MSQYGVFLKGDATGGRCQRVLIFKRFSFSLSVVAFTERSCEAFFLGKRSAVMTFPGASTTARSIAFSSSRTLPASHSPS